MTKEKKAARQRAGLERLKDHLAMVGHPFFQMRLAMRYHDAYDRAVKDYREQMEHAHALR